MPLALRLVALSLLARTAGANVLGLDVGGSNSVVAAARSGGVDVLLNEAAKRQTPSLVAFDERRRLVGLSALAQQSRDPTSCVSPKSTDGAELLHRGGRRRFSSTQLLAMLLHRLHEQARRELGAPPPDCVIAVPLHYGAARRRRVLDAAAVAGLPNARLISDGAAVALDYALGRTDLAAGGAARHVAFVDAGHEGVQVCVVAIKRDELSVLSHAFCAQGGAALDELLLSHFASDLTSTLDIDPLAQPRSALRLRGACEKLRRVLSANREGSFSLACLVGEVDAHGQLTREELEEIAAPLLSDAADACRRALSDANLPEGCILDAVELVGGFTRMPAFETAVASALGLPPSRTLNGDESVARGAALAAAMRSRSFRMRPFKVREGLLSPMRIRWEREGGGAPTGHTELPRGSTLPLQKRITLRTKARVRVTCETDLEDEASGREGAAGEGAAVREGAHAQLVAAAKLPRGPRLRGPGGGGERTLRVDVTVDEDQVPTIAAFEVVAAAQTAEEVEAEAAAVVEGEGEDEAGAEAGAGAETGAGAGALVLPPAGTLVLYMP